MRTTQMRIDQGLLLKQSPNQTFSGAEVDATHLSKADAHIFLTFPFHHIEKGPETQRERCFAVGLYSFTYASLSASPRFLWSRVSWSFGSESHHVKFQTYPIIHKFSLQEICQTPFACLSLILFTDTFKNFPTLRSLPFILRQMIPFSFQN